MAVASWCDNCNQPFDHDHPSFDVRFSVTRSGAEFGTSVSRTLCEPCSDAFTLLDVATYTSRHDARDRTLELP